MYEISFGFDAISPYKELLAYEALWLREGATLNKLTKLFQDNNKLPSQLRNDIIDLEHINEIEAYIENQLGKFSILTSRDFSYPQSLKKASNRYEIIYYNGDVGLLDLPKKISVVGTRSVSSAGIKRTINITKDLIDNECSIVSGLAHGVDTYTLQTAIDMGKKVIAVIGTPLNVYYPKENKQIQDLIAKEHLLLSHVPFYRYTKEHYLTQKYYFPQRNVIMAAISDATVIIEASETSGTLTQARECLRLGKKLFILNSCFENESITWPRKFQEKGAIRVRDVSDILDNMNG
jgi:DNA processing protein